MCFCFPIDSAFGCLYVTLDPTEAEHGYASVLPPSTEDSDKRNRQKNKKLSGPGGNR